MPQLVSLVVMDPGRVDEVMHAWVEAGVPGLTLLDSSGYAQHVRAQQKLRDDVPLFPSVRKILRATEQHSRLIFSVVQDDFDIEALIAATERVLGSLEEPGNGILFVVPLSRVAGLRRESGEPGPGS